MMVQQNWTFCWMTTLTKQRHDDTDVYSPLIIPPAQQSCWGVYWFHSVRPSVHPACRVHSVTSTVLDRFFPYQAQMTTSMRGCVAHNDHWPWAISSRSFRHDFAIKLLKYVRPPHAVSALYSLQFWMDSFHIRHKWLLAWEGVSYIMTFVLDLYLQGHSAMILQ